MVSPLRIVTMLLLMLIAHTSWALNLEVTLDSAEIVAGDTVNLTVTVDEQSFGDAPDFSPLKQDFEILSNRQSSQFSMNNGKINSTSSWILTLLPKREGFLAIPPLQYGKNTSKPLKLHVTKRRKVESVNSNDVIFMDAQVDKSDVYVQEQVIYTVRLYRRIDLHESSYTPPKVENAVMEPLGNQREYNSTVDGRSYKIIELRYAVFPQKSGELVIPSAEIVGTIFMANNRSFMFDPFNGKQIRRASPELTIRVKPQPSNYPADKPWLPARSLQLQETWTPDVSDLKVGEPVTRKITMEAEGLAQSVLPPITVPDIAGVKIYPEQAETESNIGPRGMLSDRTENFAIIPTDAGKITLPTVEVTWWDVDDDKVKIATLPSRTVDVTGAARKAQTDAQIQAPTAGNTAESAPESLTTASGNSTWQWIALIALVLWLITLIVVGIVFWRRRNPAPGIEPKIESPFSRAAEKSARSAFQTACASNDPTASRTQVIELYRQIFQTASIHNLADVLEYTPDEQLGEALRQLDAALYKSRNSTWSGEKLPTLVEQALDRKLQASKQPESKLEPLFPS